MATVVPTLVVDSDGNQSTVPVDRVPFTIGRRSGSDLALSRQGISREHACITVEGDAYVLVDQGSKFGTFVNGRPIRRHRLTRDDRITLGRGNEVSIVFDPVVTATREFLTQISSSSGQSSSSLEKLSMLLEAARRLNTQDALGEVLLTLLDTALRLTRADRGFVFLRTARGQLECAAGRAQNGDVLAAPTGISQSTVDEAARSGAKFVMTDMSEVPEPSDSVVINQLHAVVCIPLRKRHGLGATERDALVAADVLGVLYLDSWQPFSVLGPVSEEILSSLSMEAAALVENFQLAAAEEQSREYKQELEFASRIQRRLMNMRLPQLPFVACDGQTIPCRNVGGDFFDVVATPDGAALVITDVSGKGLPAALLASMLQGMIHTHLLNGTPFEHIAAAANQYVCDRMQGEKYATLVLATCSSEGTLRYINCGHLKPLHVRDDVVTVLRDSNLPIGLVESATYASAMLQLEPGDRLVLISDGVTDAENAEGEPFGDDRLFDVIRQHPACVTNVLGAVQDFAGGQPLADDCTIAEMVYRGEKGLDDAGDRDRVEVGKRSIMPPGGSR